MTSKPKVFIAGIGFSPSPPNGSPAHDFIAALVSAVTKALLDAGITYDNIARSVTTTSSSKVNYGSEALKALDEGVFAVDEAERGSELQTAIRCVRDGGAKCVLMIAIEESAAVAFVVVSESFLWSHYYLKDSAAIVRESDALQSNLEARASETLYDVCQMGNGRLAWFPKTFTNEIPVWALRGWSHAHGTTAKNGLLSYKGKGGQSIELSRADAKAIPGWEEVEHRQDGKHRLGYNPAVETKNISQEDFEAVRARGKGHRKTGVWTRFDRKGGDRAALSRL
ncbi:MAG: hypothetical protein M1822_004467 [Bathelium mastoideum]|nr:MAG: hypothetical protein M1822_004467 [Bathelium mastoideum]